jgi:hypothetical protein
MTLFCRGYVVWPAGKCGDPAARYGPFRPVAAPSHRLRIQRQNVQSHPVSFPYFRIDKAVHWLSLSTSSTSTIYSLSLSTSSASTITHCHFTLSCVLKKEPPSVFKVKYCELKQRFNGSISTSHWKYPEPKSLKVRIQELYLLWLTKSYRSGFCTSKPVSLFFPSCCVSPKHLCELLLMIV